MASFPVYTVAEINLDNLRYNYRLISQKVAPAKVMAVIKADAYGHGALAVGRTLAEAGAQYFAVARVSEAVELRQAGFYQPLLIFGSLFPDEMEVALQQGCRITLASENDLANLLKICAASRLNARVHLKIDTGMGRVGILVNEAREFIKKAASRSEIFIEGIYTHFATADSADKTFALWQLEQFKKLRSAIINDGLQIPYFHAANSGAILDLPETFFDMVRPGIALYGHYPTTETSESLPIRPVMTLKTRVVAIRRLPPGSSISYGRRYITQQETAIAVLPIGYADGISRKFTNIGKVMLNGKYYPIAGTVTMDQIMVDVGDDPIAIGDTAYFWGESPHGVISATKVAAEIGTIAYELCCAVSRRVPRVYLSQSPNDID
jgi:alanine racemase